MKTIGRVFVGGVWDGVHRVVEEVRTSMEVVYYKEEDRRMVSPDSLEPPSYKKQFYRLEDISMLVNNQMICHSFFVEQSLSLNEAINQLLLGYRQPKNSP